MPEPAGTGLSRRTFLSRSAGLALAVYGASKIPLAAFEEGIAQAAAGDKILVSVFFDGGVDALSLLAPVGDPRYAQLRPGLALPEGAGTPFSEDPTLHWHPSAAGLATLHAEGKVSAFPAIGYDDPDQSHFTSRHYYEIGELEIGFRTGWMGRYIDAVGDDDNPLQGLSMDGALSPMIATAERPVAAIDSVDGYDLWTQNVGEPISAELFRTFGRFGSLPSDSPGLAQVRRAASQTDQLRTELGGVGDFTSPVAYPDDYFSHKLAGLAAYIAAGLPMRVVTISAPGGYDTHASQAEDLADNLKATCDGLLAFQRDLEARGLDGPGPDRGLERVRAAAGGERLAGHRPRGRRVRLRDRLEGQGRDGRRVPRPGDPRRGRQRAGDERLPGDVLLAPRAVAGARRRADHPRRGGLRQTGAGEGDEGGRGGAGRAGPGPRARDRRRLGRMHLAEAREDGRQEGQAPRQGAAREAGQALVDVRARQVDARPGGPPRPHSGPTGAVAGRGSPDRPGAPRRQGRGVELHPVPAPGAAGEVIVELDNMGEDPHNLNLRMLGDEGEPFRVPITPSLQQSSRRFALAAGTYRLWCDLDEHDERGMNATLLVTAP